MNARRRYVRLCVNPWHLEAVTHAENARRGVAPAMLQHHAGVCRRGHPFSERYVKRDGKLGYCRPCRREMRRAGLWK